VRSLSERAGLNTNAHLILEAEFAQGLVHGIETGLVLALACLIKDILERPVRHVHPSCPQQSSELEAGKKEALVCERAREITPCLATNAVQSQ